MEPLYGIDGVLRTSDFPTLSEKQREALALVQSLAEQNQVKLDLRPGDLTFINNHAILHSREAFKDDWVTRRYVVRMWLKNKSLAWKLPRALQEGNSRIYDTNEVDEQWNVVATPKLRFKLSERYCS